MSSDSRGDLEPASAAEEKPDENADLSSHLDPSGSKSETTSHLEAGQNSWELTTTAKSPQDLSSGLVPPGSNNQTMSHLKPRQN